MYIYVSYTININVIKYAVCFLFCHNAIMSDIRQSATMAESKINKIIFARPPCDKK